MKVFPYKLDIFNYFSSI